MQNLWIALIGACCILVSCNKEMESTETSLSSSITALETKQAEINARAKIEQQMARFGGKTKIISSGNQKSFDDCGDQNAGSANLICFTVQRNGRVSVSIPPYSCDNVEVTYLLETCYSSPAGTTIYTIADFSWNIVPLLDEDCEQLVQGTYASSGFPFPYNLQLGEAIEYQASLAVEEELANDWFTSVVTSNSENLEVYYNRDACYKYEETTINGHPVVLLGRENIVFCGTQCCRRETSYTIHPVSGDLVAGPTIFNTYGECEQTIGEGCFDACGPSDFTPPRQAD